jgi:hypothetical protein
LPIGRWILQKRGRRSLGHPRDDRAGGGRGNAQRRQRARRRHRQDRPVDEEHRDGTWAPAGGDPARSDTTNHGDGRSPVPILHYRVMKALAGIRPLRVSSHCFFDPTARSSRPGIFWVYASVLAFMVCDSSDAPRAARRADTERGRARPRDGAARNRSESASVDTEEVLRRETAPLAFSTGCVRGRATRLPIPQ